MQEISTSEASTPLSGPMCQNFSLLCFRSYTTHCLHTFIRMFCIRCVKAFRFVLCKGKRKIGIARDPPKEKTLAIFQNRRSKNEVGICSGVQISITSKKVGLGYQGMTRSFRKPGERLRLPIVQLAMYARLVRHFAVVASFLAQRFFGSRFPFPCAPCWILLLFPKYLQTLRPSTWDCNCMRLASVPSKKSALFGSRFAFSLCPMWHAAALPEFFFQEWSGIGLPCFD